MRQAMSALADGAALRMIDGIQFAAVLLRAFLGGVGSRPLAARHRLQVKAERFVRRPAAPELVEGWRDPVYSP